MNQQRNSKQIECVMQAILNGKSIQNVGAGKRGWRCVQSKPYVMVDSTGCCCSCSRICSAMGLREKQIRIT